MFDEKVREIELADGKLQNLKNDLGIEGAYSDAGFAAAYGSALDAVISLQEAEIERLDGVMRGIRKV
jgi:hypothetical protein